MIDRGPWADAEGFGVAGFLMAYAVLSVMRGMHIIDDALINLIFDEAQLLLEQVGVGEPERAAAHRLLKGMVDSGAAFPMKAITQ
jgi:hypothetical protein